MSRAAATQRALGLILVGLLVAIAAVLLGGHTGQSGASTTGASELASTTGSSGFVGPTMPANIHAANFALTDENGHRVSLAQYRGQVVVLTFVHSLCHDTCPFMVEQIKGALNDLPGGEHVPAIGISVDHAQDTVRNRRMFLAKHEMEGRLAFLNGPLPRLRAIWHAYAIQPVVGKDDHSTFVLLIDKRGIERVGFPASLLTPEGLAHDIGVLERESV